MMVDGLNEQLKEFGHQTEVLKIPFLSCYPAMPAQMKAIRSFRISDKFDKLIAVRTPSYLIKHPEKVIWFIHHHRGAYDFWGTEYQDIPDTKSGRNIRSQIIEEDNKALREAEKIFANSREVQNRLKTFNHIDAEVLYPPLANNHFYCQEYGDFLFYPSRVVHHKRQHLAIEAMKYTKSNVKLLIAGQTEKKEMAAFLEKIIKVNGLFHKVMFINKWISEGEKISFMANALACVYIPFAEDSYGYPTLEAFSAKKPVITCMDSGGTLEIVQDNETGFISVPDPRELANCFDQLYFDKKLAKRLGEAGYEKMKSMNISWEHVIRRLLH